MPGIGVKGRILEQKTLVLSWAIKVQEQSRYQLCLFLRDHRFLHMHGVKVRFYISVLLSITACSTLGSSACPNQFLFLFDCANQEDVKVHRQRAG